MEAVATWARALVDGTEGVLSHKGQYPLKISHYMVFLVTLAHFVS